jgi:hypothetical protein
MKKRRLGSGYFTKDLSNTSGDNKNFHVVFPMLLLEKKGPPNFISGTPAWRCQAIGYFGEIGHLFGMKTAGCPVKSATPIL